MGTPQNFVAQVPQLPQVIYLEIGVPGLNIRMHKPNHLKTLQNLMALLSIGLTFYPGLVIKPGNYHPTLHKTVATAQARPDEPERWIRVKATNYSWQEPDHVRYGKSNCMGGDLTQLAEKAAENISIWLSQNLALCLALPWLVCVRYRFGEIFILKHVPHVVLGLVFTLGVGYLSPNVFFPNQHPSLYVLLPIVVYAVISAALNYAVCIHLSLAEPAIVWDSKSSGIQIFNNQTESSDRMRWSEPLPPLALSVVCALFGLTGAAIWFLITGLAIWLVHTLAYYQQYIELLEARDRMIQDGEIRSQQDLDLIRWLTQAANGDTTAPMPKTTSYQPNERLQIRLQQLQDRYRARGEVTLPPSIESIPPALPASAPKPEPVDPNHP